MKRPKVLPERHRRLSVLDDLRAKILADFCRVERPVFGRSVRRRHGPRAEREGLSHLEFLQLVIAEQAYAPVNGASPVAFVRRSFREAKTLGDVRLAVQCPSH